jgi:hypothetical protein
MRDAIYADIDDICRMRRHILSFVTSFTPVTMLLILRFGSRVIMRHSMQCPAPVHFPPRCQHVRNKPSRNFGPNNGPQARFKAHLWAQNNRSSLSSISIPPKLPKFRLNYLTSKCSGTWKSMMTEPTKTCLRWNTHGPYTT